MSQNNSQNDQQAKSAQDNKSQINKKEKEEELSEEDKAMKERIDLYIQRMIEDNLNLSQVALDSLCLEVKEATTSMTSVPKPFRFLKNYYQTLVEFYEKIQDSQYKKNLADFLSVLSMTFGDPEKQISLNFLMKGTQQNFRTWGHEYLSHIAGEIGITYNKRLENKEPVDDLLILADFIIPYFIQNNQETDAIDFMIEVDKIEELTKYVEHKNFQRIILYLTNCSLYSADQDEQVKTLNVSFKICMNLKEYTHALRIALKLDKFDLIKQVIENCQDPLIQKQLAFNLARQRINYDYNDEQLQNIVSNKFLTDYYQKLAKDLEVEEPKHPHKIYKTHLEESRNQVSIDSALQNLAHTYVNAFVNLGSRKDALLIQQEDTKKDPWIYKVKNEGLIAASASIGMLFLWDPENAQQHIDEYTELTDGLVKTGSYIALGIVNSGIKDENDPAKAILEEKINGKEEYSKLGSIIGLGMAYAGSAREDILDTLIPLIIDTNINLELSAFAALSASLIFVGKCNEEVGNAILQTLMERGENQLNISVARFFSVALGLLFMSQQEACEATLEAINLIQHKPTAKYTEICIQGCAYIGSGNVLKVQQMFHQCIEQLEEKDASHQAIAVISLALIAMSDDIGNQMCLRSLNHLTQYGNIVIKRAIPLAIAILNLSNPNIQAQDLLQKLSHDQDQDVSMRAILCIGLIGFGTNNSRLAGNLRQLAAYYNREQTVNHLFCVRIAMGFLHAGKGLVSIQPYYSDRFLFSHVSIAGIVILIHTLLDVQNLILGKYHYLMYYLALSIYPRMCFTLDENLENQPVNVRVGQAVDTVGQAGQPKKITGFQTHISPVILSYGERAELATDEYIPIIDQVLENFVIIKKNPEYQMEIEQNINSQKK